MFSLTNMPKKSFNGQKYLENSKNNHLDFQASFNVTRKKSVFNLPMVSKEVTSPGKIFVLNEDSIKKSDPRIIRDFITDHPSIVLETNFLCLLVKNKTKFELFRWVINQPWVTCDPKLSKIPKITATTKKMNKQDPWEIEGVIPTISGKISEFLQTCLRKDVEACFLKEIIGKYKKMGFFKDRTKLRTISIAFSRSLIESPLEKIEYLASEGVEIIADLCYYNEISATLMSSEKVELLIKNSVQYSLLSKLLLSYCLENIDPEESNVPKLIRKYHPGFFSKPKAIISAIRLILWQRKIDKSWDEFHLVSKFFSFYIFSEKFWSDRPIYSKYILDSFSGSSENMKRRVYFRFMINQGLPFEHQKDEVIQMMFCGKENSISEWDLISCPKTTINFFLRVLSNTEASTLETVFIRGYFRERIQRSIFSLYISVFKVKFAQWLLPLAKRNKSGEIIVHDPFFNSLCNLPIQIVCQILRQIFSREGDAVNFDRFVSIYRP